MNFEIISNMKHTPSDQKLLTSRETFYWSDPTLLNAMYIHTGTDSSLTLKHILGRNVENY